MTIIAVQCRLSSTRLPNKALLHLGEKELLRWTLAALKRIKVDEYWIATDEHSYATISKIGNEEGWKCIQGPEDDVLERYCMLIKETGADIVLRATADNPFLFFEAGEKSLIEFSKRNCDYFAFTGLPHGSGIEVFSAKSLLKARDCTKDVYDHEHVGPALYRHPETFNSVFEKAPNEWTHELDNFPYRTTVDTITDFRQVCRIHGYLSKKGIEAPYSASDIFLALKSSEVQKTILLVPSVKAGRGTGHIRRILQTVHTLDSEYGIFACLYIDEEQSVEVRKLIKNALETGFINKHCIVSTMPKRDDFSVIITDMFMMSESFVKELQDVGNLIAIDEGSSHTVYIDYLLDIIPSLSEGKGKNAFLPSLIRLPTLQQKDVKAIKNILICIGGEDPANYDEVIYNTLKKICVDANIESTKQKEISNLKDCIHNYDLVITHFGFTAFEALSAGCAVLTVATSSIHVKLSKKYGLKCIKKSDCNEKSLKKIITNFHLLYAPKLTSLLNDHSDTTLESYIARMIKASRYSCPICQDEQAINKVVSRDNVKTIRKCRTCKIHYISYCLQEEKEYSKDYFFDEYKNQYGKTYLEDFDMIKLLGFLRMTRILKILKYKKKNIEDTVLDIGCAYGPFLEAVKMFSVKSFKPYGTDISQDAVEYVSKTLGIFASTSSFPDFNVEKSFGKNSPENEQFRVVTMWYVIEHFQNLDKVLRKVNSLLVPGGVFAFSTPNALGISRRNNQKGFFKQSPYDHYSIWDLKSAKKILKQYGFKIKKAVPTGIHRHRYPKIVQRLHISVIEILAKMFFLGDTFEIYCIKQKDL